MNVEQSARFLAGCAATAAPPAPARLQPERRRLVSARAEHRKLSERTTLCVQCMACSR
jgi:hypothetical protein